MAEAQLLDPEVPLRLERMHRALSALADLVAAQRVPDPAGIGSLFALLAEEARRTEDYCQP